jgi:hypothetical protein
MIFVGMTLGVGWIFFAGKCRRYRERVRSLETPSCEVSARQLAVTVQQIKGSHIRVEVQNERFALALLASNLKKAVNTEFEMIDRATELVAAQISRRAEVREPPSE